MPRKSLKVVEPPEPQYFWRRGFVPPKGVDVAQVKLAIDQLPEPEPEELYEASKDQSHVLHDSVWSEGDQEWARRARIEYCRRIISNVVEIVKVGGREIQTRSYEFVRTDGRDRWSSINDIMKDEELRDAHLAAIQRLQEEAVGKMARFRELLRGT